MRVNSSMVVLAAMLTPCYAQWIKYPTAGIPRLPDGQPDMNAPAPKQANGRPDLSGLWQPPGGYVGNIARDLPADAVPFQPWAAELYNQRRETLSKDDPTGWCVPGGVPRSDAVPYPFRVLHSPESVVILYEAVHHFRQIFSDGRALPKNPNPTWMGYSVGRWEGDAFVAETIGFVENSWLDNFGKPGTEMLKVTERFERRDFGHMALHVTIDDPKAYTKPWTITMQLNLLADTELLEYICGENNKDLDHLVGK